MDLPCSAKNVVVTMYSYNAVRHKIVDVEGGRGFLCVAMGNRACTLYSMCEQCVHVNHALYISVEERIFT